MPTEKTQEAQDPFALDLFLAVAIPVIFAMTVNGMLGVDRARWPVTAESEARVCITTLQKQGPAVLATPSNRPAPAQPHPTSHRDLKPSPAN